MIVVKIIDNDESFRIGDSIDKLFSLIKCHLNKPSLVHPIDDDLGWWNFSFSEWRQLASWEKSLHHDKKKGFSRSRYQHQDKDIWPFLLPHKSSSQSIADLTTQPKMCFSIRARRSHDTTECRLLFSFRFFSSSIFMITHFGCDVNGHWWFVLIVLWPILLCRFGIFFSFLERAPRTDRKNLLSCYANAPASAWCQNKRDLESMTKVNVI